MQQEKVSKHPNCIQFFILYTSARALFAWMEAWHWDWHERHYFGEKSKTGRELFRKSFYIKASLILKCLLSPENAHKLCKYLKVA